MSSRAKKRKASTDTDVDLVLHPGPWRFPDGDALRLLVDRSSFEERPNDDIEGDSGAHSADDSSGLRASLWMAHEELAANILGRTEAERREKVMKDQLAKAEADKTSAVEALKVSEQYCMKCPWCDFISEASLSAPSKCSDVLQRGVDPGRGDDEGRRQQGSRRVEGRFKLRGVMNMIGSRRLSCSVSSLTCVTPVTCSTCQV